MAKQKKTVYKVDTFKLKKYAAIMAGNGIGLTGYMAAVNLLQAIMFAQKGAEKRDLTPDECTNLIHQGGFR